MELYQLRTFVAVAEEGSLTRAAERLFTSQPAVSAQIRALEEEFGLRLFERTSSGMAPTVAGEALWEEAERVLNAARDLSVRASALKGRVAGRLKFGLNNDGAVVRSPALLSRLAEEYPELSFDVSYGTSGSILQGIVARELDAGFYEGACDDLSVELVPLANFALVVAMPRAWAAELTSPDWACLARRPWSFVSPLCSYHRLIERLMGQYGLPLQPRFQVEEDATALHLVQAGSALTVTTREALRHHGLDTSPDIALWPHFTHELPLSLGYLRTRAQDPVITALRQAALSVWQPAETTALEA